jgi:hypothetical protein
MGRRARHDDSRRPLASTRGFAMSGSRILFALAVLGFSAGGSSARAQDLVPESYAAEATDEDDAGDDDCPEKDYNDVGVVELGGSVGVNWTEDLFSVDAGPSIGWFLLEGFELSLIMRLEYENEEDDDGVRTRNTVGSLIVEPSYHFPIREQSLYGFGGLGIGVGYDGDDPDFELVPRVGLNVELGPSGVLTPAIRVPILVGRNSGENDDELGVDPGFAFEVGFTTTMRRR